MKEHFTADLARYILYCAPDAIAWISGTEGYPRIAGKIYYWEIEDGVFVEIELAGLPSEERTGNNTNMFSIKFISNDVGSINEFNASDINKYEEQNYSELLPLIISNKGIAWYTVFTNQFKVSDMVGSTAAIYCRYSDKINQQNKHENHPIASGVIKYNQY